MKKRLLLLIAALTCMFALSACSAKETPVEFTYDESAFRVTAEAFLTNWFAFDFQGTIDQYGSQMTEEDMGTYLNSITVRDEVGTFGSVKETVLSQAGDVVVATVTAECSGGTLEFKVDIDSTGNPVGFKAERKVSLAETMEKAGINTVLSMSIVFCVLIFISFIIGLLKFIPRLFESKAKKLEAVQLQPSNSIAEVEVSETEEEEIPEDDSEIAAVIMAAIAAYQGENPEVPADGLVVRSIRKRNPRMSY